MSEWRAVPDSIKGLMDDVRRRIWARSQQSTGKQDLTDAFGVDFDTLSEHTKEAMLDLYAWVLARLGPENMSKPVAEALSAVYMLGFAVGHRFAQENDHEE